MALGKRCSDYRVKQRVLFIKNGGESKLYLWLNIYKLHNND